MAEKLNFMSRNKESPYGIRVGCECLHTDFVRAYFLRFIGLSRPGTLRLCRNIWVEDTDQPAGRAEEFSPKDSMWLSLTRQEYGCLAAARFSKSVNCPETLTCDSGLYAKKITRLRSVLFQFALQCTARNIKSPGRFRDVPAAIGQYPLDVFPLR